MEIKDIHKIQNPIFDRRELQAIIVSDISPSNKEVITLLSKEFSVPEGGIKLKGIYGKFGSREFQIKANIYKSKEEKDKIERKTKKEVENEKKEAEAVKKVEEEKKKEVEVKEVEVPKEVEEKKE